MASLDKSLLQTWPAILERVRRCGAGFERVRGNPKENAKRLKKLGENLPELLGGLPDDSRVPPYRLQFELPQGDGTIREFYIESEEGVVVPIWFYRPGNAKDDGPLPTVVLVGEGREWSVWRNAIESFLAAGYLVVFVDQPSGSERSTHEERTRPSDSINQVMGFYTGRPWLGLLVWDLIKALDFLEAMPEVDSRRLSLVGLESTGVGVAIASVYRKWVSLSVGVFCGSTYRDLAETIDGEPLWLPRGFIPGLLEYGDLDDIYALRAPSPLLLVNSRDDARIPEATFSKLSGHLESAYESAGDKNAFASCVVDCADLTVNLNLYKETRPHPLWGRVIEETERMRGSSEEPYPTRSPPAPSERNLGYTTARGPHLTVRDDDAFSTLRRMQRTATTLLKKHSLKSRGISLPQDQSRLRQEYLEMLGGPPERVPLDPQTVKTWTEDGLTHEHVYFHTEAQSIQSTVVVRRADLESESLPAIMVHPGWGEKKDAYLPAARGFAQAGFTAITLDPRGQGEREMPPSSEGRWADFTPFEKEVVMSLGFSWLVGTSHNAMYCWDIARTVDYLQTRSDVDGERIGLTGLCMGGLCSWMGGAYDTRIKVVVPICNNSTFEALALFGAGHHCAALTHIPPGMMRWGDFPDLAALIAPRPLFLLSSTEDNWFPLVGTRDLLTRVRAVYETFGCPEHFDFHLEAGPHQYIDRYSTRVSDFFHQWL